MPTVSAIAPNLYQSVDATAPTTDPNQSIDPPPHKPPGQPRVPHLVPSTTRCQRLLQNNHPSTAWNPRRSDRNRAMRRAQATLPLAGKHRIAVMIEPHWRGQRGPGGRMAPHYDNVWNFRAPISQRDPRPKPERACRSPANYQNWLSCDTNHRSAGQLTYSTWQGSLMSRRCGHWAKPPSLPSALAE
jgi:hypothetical protein